MMKKVGMRNKESNGLLNSMGILEVENKSSKLKNILKNTTSNIKRCIKYRFIAYGINKLEQKIKIIQTIEENNIGEIKGFYEDKMISRLIYRVVPFQGVCRVSWLCTSNSLYEEDIMALMGIYTDSVNFSPKFKYLGTLMLEKLIDTLSNLENLRIKEICINSLPSSRIFYIKSLSYLEKMKKIKKFQVDDKDTNRFIISI